MKEETTRGVKDGIHTGHSQIRAMHEYSNHVECIHHVLHQTYQRYPLILQNYGKSIDGRVSE
jgi:hypothetical protein